MARQASAPPPKRHAQIPPAAIPDAITALRRRLDEIRSAEPPASRDRDELRNVIASLCTKAYATYRDVFGEGTVETEEAGWFGYDFVLDNESPYLDERIPWPQDVDAFAKGIASVRSKFETQIQLLEEKLTHVAGSAPTAGVSAAPAIHDGDRVFIVHGHDSSSKTEVARFLERAGLEVTILHEQANSGRTIIEKLEQHSETAGFAVVLLTPDDVGCAAPFLVARMRPRARQNVLLELGWFAGKLGRSRVCALKKGDIEVPSDFAGVGYVDMDDRGAWKAELLKELGAAGYTLDWPKAMA